MPRAARPWLLLQQAPAQLCSAAAVGRWGPRGWRVLVQVVCLQVLQVLRARPLRRVVLLAQAPAQVQLAQQVARAQLRPVRAQALLMLCAALQRLQGWPPVVLQQLLLPGQVLVARPCCCWWQLWRVLARAHEAPLLLLPLLTLWAHLPLQQQQPVASAAALAPGSPAALPAPARPPLPWPPPCGSAPSLPAHPCLPPRRCC